MGLFNLFKKKEADCDVMNLHTRSFSLAGVVYHDLPKLMKRIPGRRPTAEELESSLCDYMPAKTYRDACTYQIEHGVFEGAVRIYMKRYFIGYIAESDLPEFYEILKHNICNMTVYIEGGKRYMLGKNGKMYTEDGYLNAILNVNFEI